MANQAVVSSQTTSTPLLVQHNPPLGYQYATFPSILIALTSGASLTYTVEVTGDDIPTTNGSWVPLSAASSGLTASCAILLQGRCTGIRLNVTTWASGSATITVVN